MCSTSLRLFRCGHIIISRQISSCPTLLAADDSLRSSCSSSSSSLRLFRCRRVIISRPISSTVAVDQLRCSNTTGKEVDKYPEGKPSWDKLQHICIRLAESWPTFFLRKMDYTVFRDDVLLEDRIYGSHVRGVHQYMKYLGTIAAAGRLMYPQVEMHILNLTPFIEDATVRMRWRVYYLTYFDFLIMLLSFRKFTTEYLKQQGRWIDGYSIYYADSSGAVYKHVIDKVMPDEEKPFAKGRLTLAQRIQALLGASSAQKSPATPNA